VRQGLAESLIIGSEAIDLMVARKSPSGPQARKLHAMTEQRSAFSRREMEEAQRQKPQRLATQELQFCARLERPDDSLRRRKRLSVQSARCDLEFRMACRASLDRLVGIPLRV